MKSLEIVKNVLKVYEMDGSTFGLLYTEDIKAIKADLEILEIIKKYIFKDYKLAKIYGISVSDYWLGIRDKYLNEVNFPIDKEEYNKLKQWLEENE